MTQPLVFDAICNCRLSFPFLFLPCVPQSVLHEACACSSDKHDTTTSFNFMSLFVLKIIIYS
jgi:hypothetical protein